MASRGQDPQRSILKDAVGVQSAELAPVGPQLLFPAARIDILRGQDPVTGVPIVNMVITAGNGALSVVCPIPALVSPQQAMAGGPLVPANVQIAEKLVAPEYRLVKVDASALEDAPAAAGGVTDVEAETHLFDPADEAEQQRYGDLYGEAVEDPE